jgi:hypothetical protein
MMNRLGFGSSLQLAVEALEAGSLRQQCEKSSYISMQPE